MIINSNKNLIIFLNFIITNILNKIINNFLISMHIESKYI